MSKNMARAFVAVAAAAASSMLGASGAAASGAAARVPQPGRALQAEASEAPAAPGAQLWVTRYNGPTGGYDEARSVAVGPGGGRVFVTGSSAGARTGADYATAAYSPTTGAQLWVKRYNGPGNGGDETHSVAVSPAGGRVFVTGASPGPGSRDDYATVAYNATTGAWLWTRRYNGPANSEDRAWSVSVSPNGRQVFVTGDSAGSSSGPDYATVAYNAATGTRLWVKRYNGYRRNADQADSLAVSPSGRQVFVTGYSTRASMGTDYTTIAYNANTGTWLWTKHYDGPASNLDYARSMAVSPDGATVFVTGYSDGGTFDYATVAYNAATGAQLWVSRYNGPRSDDDFAESLAVSRTGRQVFVTGSSPGVNSASDYATVAYDATSGAQEWVARYSGPGNPGSDEARSVVVTHTGDEVFVTGSSAGATSGGYATIAYSAATGAQLWARRFIGSGWSAATSPTSGTIYVTGTGRGPGGGDYTTIAYNG